MSVSYEMAVCPACGSGPSETAADAGQIRQEQEGLWEFHMRRLRDGAPHARLSDLVVFSQEPPLHLASCGRCGTVFRTPRRPARDLTSMYESESVDRESLARTLDRSRAVARRQTRLLTRLAGGPGRVVEVGSHAGAFLEEARAGGWEVLGVEPGAAAADWLEARDLPVWRGTLDTLPIERGRWDAVAIWNCLDQVPDPRETLVAARALLGPGGLLGVRVPNGAFYRRLRTSLGRWSGRAATALLAWNNLLGFPYRTGFTPPSLARLLTTTGYSVVRVRGDALVRLADRWTRGWAALEERAVKTMLIAGAARVPSWAPWFEMFAKAERRD